MKLFRDLVLIKPEEPKQQTASGIYIKEDWKTLPPIGEVIDIGPEVKEIKKGDRVIFERYGSIVTEIDDVKCRLCQESQVFGVIKD